MSVREELSVNQDAAVKRRMKEKVFTGGIRCLP
jgi:hypothetical protein